MIITNKCVFNSSRLCRQRGCICRVVVINVLCVPTIKRHVIICVLRIGGSVYECDTTRGMSLTRTYSHTRTHSLTRTRTSTHIHTRTHTHTHACKHTHARTRTHYMHIHNNSNNRLPEHPNLPPHPIATHDSTLICTHFRVPFERTHNLRIAT